MFAKNQTFMVFIENKIVDMSSSVRIFFKMAIISRFGGLGPDFLYVAHNFIDVLVGIE